MLLSWWRRLLATLVVVLATIASGTLECNRGEATVAEGRGRQVYGNMCAVCHGAGGEGYKADHAPALAQQDFLASVTDDALRVAITYGRAGTVMSAWGRERGGPLSVADVKAVVAFIRAWQTLPDAHLDESVLEGDAEQGEKVYARDCTGCHGAKGAGAASEGLGSPMLTGSTNGFLRYAIRDGRPGTAMPGFRAALGTRSIDDVIAFLRSIPAPAVTRATPAKMPPIPLGPVPLNPHGPDPDGFKAQPATTGADLVKAQLDHGAKMAILDARAPTDYANEHIAGAVSVPFYDPAPYFDKLPKDSWLVCYCACPHAESGQLAQKLVAHGFSKVTVLNEGLGYWKSKKYGTREGTEP